MGKIEARLKELDIQLMEVEDYGVSFKRYICSGNYIYISGHGPDWLPTKKIWNGKLGSDYTIEEGYEAARHCGYNLLSTLKWAISDMDRVQQIVRILGAVNSTPDFTEHTKVVFGCSDLMRNVFGEAGYHSRIAIGCSSLPQNWPCEIEMLVEVN